ncbi:hypothetical protein P4672_27400 [Priestia megaterium]|uniref:hypothetical protein n=1 Tax=Priestia megaterium TaxID=1404 RepID=UPI002E1BF2ED|nr:hypothetical protein [Priestia megaterium]
MNKETMFKFYELLCEIETSLIHILEIEMKNTHGPLWRKIFYVEGRTYLHDTISSFFRFASLNDIFSSYELRELRTLINIRNKICHMISISSEEFQTLKGCHSIVLQKGPRQHYIIK